jgi:hypothetical protein
LFAKGYEQNGKISRGGNFDYRFSVFGIIFSFCGLQKTISFSAMRLFIVDFVCKNLSDNGK